MKYDNDPINVFPFDAEELPFTPRRTALTQSASVKRFAAVAALLVVPNLFLAWAFFTTDDLSDLRALGKSLQGQVTKKRESSAGRGGTTYTLGYKFWSGKAYLEGEGTVDRDKFKAAEEGTPVEVTYLPSKPEVHCLGKPGPRLEVKIDSSLALAGMFALLFGSLLVAVEWKIRRQQHLLAGGMPVVGMIDDRGTSPTKAGGVRYWANYRFTDDRHNERRGWTYVPQAIYDDLKLGRQVLLLVDHENTTLHLPVYAMTELTLLAEREKEAATA